MDELAAYERRFRRAGLPLLIEDYSASEDIFTRVAPLLAFIAFLEVFGAVDLSWPWWANVATVLGALAVLLGALALRNHARGRPAFAIPERVGPVELAIFVLVPALLPVVFNQQVTSALVTAAGNVLILLVAWGVVGFGLLSIVRWAGARLVTQLAASIPLVARAVPLLMLFAVVLFLTTEMWQVFAEMELASLIAIVALLMVIGSLFVVGRIPREVGALAEQAAHGVPPLRRAQRVNVGMVLFVSQALQVLVVALAVGVFFVVFGLLAIDDGVLDAWLGHAGHAIVDWSVFGVRIRPTQELLRVATAIAALSGLYYAIAVLTDATYREEFLDEVTGDMRETFADRGRYLALRAG
ncbi:hypothetical protein DSM104299_01387 [Baekduia alba]|uniref:hypothetical protein n=1 Tax=Baekduia alba TaxID=2997333 RepID=UPI0023401C21|nr:hypothetical protein [Baekduia alba]WCB92689.1 hypothetical protein DSM104299_01387 [Baekduia alba]